VYSFKQAKRDSSGLHFSETKSDMPLNPASVAAILDIYLGAAMSFQKV
jgi:hypothetical protein